jgi:hypothetical protein
MDLEALIDAALTKEEQTRADALQRHHEEEQPQIEKLRAAVDANFDAGVLSSLGLTYHAAYFDGHWDVHARGEYQGQRLIIATIEMPGEAMCWELHSTKVGSRGLWTSQDRATNTHHLLVFLGSMRSKML